MAHERSDALVFFGATGDLAFKQIFPALQALITHGRLAMPIVAVGRKPLDIDKLRARVKESLDASGETASGAAFEELSKRLQYVDVDYETPASFDRIKKAIGDARHPLHYVALPPKVYETVARCLAHAGLAERARIVLEKPFGSDLGSARALSEALYAYFPEDAIFRIDHFLGKEPVENIAYFRAANPLIETALRHDHVESVQITMAETFGVKGRAKFYDDVGAMRDVVQNHMLELVACLAMDLPEAQGHTALREARSKLLARVNPLSPSDVVRGQVRGYQAEEGVAKDSTTETFVVVRLTIDLPRWKGVPFFIRAGKSLPVTATEVLVRWKAPGAKVLDEASRAAPNHLRFRISPDAVIALGANVKKSGEEMVGEPTELIVSRAAANAGAMKAYERLLGDAVDGDATLYARRDAVEECWRIMGRALGDATPVHSYEPGLWGPAEAWRIQPPGGWRDPS